MDPDTAIIPGVTMTLTSASGANSASGTSNGTGGDAVILAIPQNELPALMTDIFIGQFWLAVRPAHGAQDAVVGLASPCSIFGNGLTLVQLKKNLPVCLG